MNAAVPIWEKRLLTVDEAALYTNIGQNRIAELLKKPSCPFVIYVGRKKLVKRKEFERYLDENIEID
jgi:excisionase family DNA binding protein